MRRHESGREREKETKRECVRDFDRDVGRGGQVCVCEIERDGD